MPVGEVSSSCKLSVKVCKTCFESHRILYEKLTQSKSGWAPTEMIEKHNWIQDKFNFLKTHIRCKGIAVLVQAMVVVVFKQAIIIEFANTCFEVTMATWDIYIRLRVTGWHQTSQGVVPPI